jgi:hypothetical protein
VLFARNASAALAAGIVDGFLPAQSADLAAAVASAADQLDTDEKLAVNTAAAYHEAIENVQTSHATLIDLLVDVKFSMRGVRAADDKYLALGFPAPAPAGREVELHAPTGLSVSGTSNGVNTLKFTGNNTPGRVTYIIEARTSRTVPFWIVGMSTKQTWEHIDVVPGQFYQYRVCALASRRRFSDYSNEAEVYANNSA